MALRMSAVVLPQVSSISFLGAKASKLPSSRRVAWSRGARRRRSGWRCACTLSSASESVTMNPAAVTERPSSMIRKIQKDLASGEKTAVAVIEGYLARLREREPHVNSFLHVSERAIDEARIFDEKISQNGAAMGLLTGVPIAVKDNLCTNDMPSTGGSRILEGYRPPFDATAVRKLREAGAVIVGKTNLDEFGMGSSCENSAFKSTANPWDVSRVPGGSSGGSAAAVAARQCAGSLGSDTGGSVRLPASFCGVVGIKPSYGRVSRFGLMAYASSLDVVGCLSASVLDSAILLQAIAGYDSADSTCSQMEVPDFVGPLLQEQESLGSSKPLAGFKVGLLMDTLGDGVEDGVASIVRTGAAHLESLGAALVEVSVPRFALGLPAYYVLAASEASSNLSRYDGARYGKRVDGSHVADMFSNSRGQGLGAEVKRRILMGTYALSAGYYDAFYKRAQQVRTLVQNDFKAAFETVDVLLSPVSATPAYKLGEKVDDPLAMFAGDLMTVNVNLAGLPSLVVPAGLSGGLPVGIQMIGRPFDEVSLLKLGHVFEQTQPPWCNTSPPALVQ